MESAVKHSLKRKRSNMSTSSQASSTAVPGAPSRRGLKNVPDISTALAAVSASARGLEEKFVQTRLERALDSGTCAYLRG